MRPLSSFVLLFLVFLALPCSAQSSTDVPRDGLELLKRVARHYADAKSYRIESVEERQMFNAFRHSWEKTVLVAAEAPGNRFRYEGKTEIGDSLRISDGSSVWIYRGGLQLFTKEVSGQENKNRVVGMDEVSRTYAQDLRSRMVDLARALTAARRLKDSTILVHGRKIPCYVVLVDSKDLKRKRVGLDYRRTLWIDKKGETLIRSEQRGHNLSYYPDGGNTSFEETITTTYEAELDSQLPEALFTFTPPTDAKFIERFPDPMLPGGGRLRGQEAPPLNLKSASGEMTALASFRGKPVLLDIWATWCAPCITNLEHIAKLYGDLKEKGIVVITVDEDEEAKTATDFLAKKNYQWSNFHDDGITMNLLGPSGVPRTIVIDARGKVVYDGLSWSNDGSEKQLCTAIAQLGPDYAFAPKSATTPCGVVATTKDSR